MDNLFVVRLNLEIGRFSFVKQAKFVVGICFCRCFIKLPQQSTLTITIIFRLLFYNECESRDATLTKRNTFQNRYEKWPNQNRTEPI